MPIFTKVGSTHKVVFRAWLKEAGVWKELERVYYKFGNVWHVVHRPILPFVFNDTLTGTVYNYNLRERAQLAGWTPDRALIATVNLVNCTVAALIDGTYAFTSGITFLEGSNLTLNLDANSKIIGKGGKGGKGGSITNAEDGGSGRPALFLNIPTYLNNLGTIAGGGGGAGAGGCVYAFDTYNGANIYAGGYAGAGGAGLGLPGIHGITKYNDLTVTPQAYYNNGNVGLLIKQCAPEAAAGSMLAGGVMYTGLYQGFYPESVISDTYYEPTYGDIATNFAYYGGSGGNGGALGSAGSQGTLGVIVQAGQDIIQVRPFSNGGPGAKAIIGFSFCTVISLGTIIGGTD